jgi:glycosyltransferase involved in cell wall biosynthesis
MPAPDSERDFLNPSEHQLRLSIVVNNYNYAKFLPEALDSALAQMHAGDELVVVDDGSTDDSPAILRQYEIDHGIRLIRQENQGQMRAVRVGIDAARGDVVVLLDSDDVFLDGYLERLRKIYTDCPDISFVFANAQLRGESDASIQQMSGVLNRMEFSPGPVGTTKWAALLFHEFVGIPTSGNSLHRTLAIRSIDLPAEIDETTALSPLITGLLGISKGDQKQFGHTADGVIVRAASILGARKYYDERPGFIYRIHGSNKYATVPRLGRWYLRRKRKMEFRRIVQQHFSLSTKPTAVELKNEILGRSFSQYPLRRLFIRGNYCRAILTSKGSPGEKIAALSAALGLGSRNS